MSGGRKRPPHEIAEERAFAALLTSAGLEYNGMKSAEEVRAAARAKEIEERFDQQFKEMFENPRQSGEEVAKEFELLRCRRPCQHRSDRICKESLQGCSYIDGHHLCYKCACEYCATPAHPREPLFGGLFGGGETSSSSSRVGKRKRTESDELEDLIE